MPEKDMAPLDEKGLLGLVSAPGLDIRPQGCVESTNTLLCRLAREGAGDGTVVLASSQTGGRGRRGRSFFSPPGTGVYLSVLLRRPLRAEAAGCLTAMAAVAAAEAAELISGHPAGIKWVNDVLQDGKKVCGILTEGAVSPSGMLEWAVIGAGINVFYPEGGFPPDIAERAGALLPAGTPRGLWRERAAACVIDGIIRRAARVDDAPWYDDYRKRLVTLGRSVTVASGEYAGEAVAEDIDRSFGLIVRLPDGERRVIRSGEALF